MSNITASPSSLQSDQRLLQAIQSFIAEHPHPDVQRFQANIAEWGHEHLAVASAHMPAADTLASTRQIKNTQTGELLSLFVAEQASRRWEQGYTKSDGLVGEDMLSGYGFTEVIGKYGPFCSTRVRAGIAVWGTNINYPLHRHKAEEVYILLAGSAEFCFSKDTGIVVEKRNTGDAVYVPSMLTHGFRTKNEPLVVFYLWQGGDLREKSSFS